MKARAGASVPYHEKARRQIERELALIEKLESGRLFPDRLGSGRILPQQGILVQGRGSAANSAVCYSLGITAVDPVAMDLLFERFLSEERGEWPDIDLDLPSRRSARARDSIRLPALRRARRGHDRQRHHLSWPVRRARYRQGAGVRAGGAGETFFAGRALGLEGSRRYRASGSSRKPASI